MTLADSADGSDQPLRTEHQDEPNGAESAAKSDPVEVSALEAADSADKVPADQVPADQVPAPQEPTPTEEVKPADGDGVVGDVDASDEVPPVEEPKPSEDAEAVEEAKPAEEARTAVETAAVGEPPGSAEPPALVRHPVTAAHRSAEPAPSRAGWWAPVTIGLCVLVVALLVSLVVGGVKVASDLSTDHDREAALAAGRSAAVSLTTFDYTTADKDVARLKRMTTSNFENGFASDTTAFLAVIKQGKEKMTSQVTEAGVVSYAGNTAHVLVVLKAQLSNGQQPQPHKRDFRLDVGLVYQQGQWLANAAQFIS